MRSVDSAPENVVGEELIHWAYFAEVPCGKRSQNGVALVEWSAGQGGDMWPFARLGTVCIQR